MWTILAFLPLLRAGPTKKIASISSSAGDLDSNMRLHSTSMTAYSCTKAAMNMLNLKFANQLRDEGFICVAVSPGIVNTAETTPGKRRILIIMHHFSRLTSPLAGELPPGFDAALNAIAKGYPGWTPIAYTPQQSVNKMLNTIAKLTPEDSGEFMSEKGTKILYKD